jgi:hypothetical protein
MLSDKVNYLRKLPRSVSIPIRNALVYPRYWRHARLCGKGYKQYAADYKNPILFVMGLPKSGSTWLEKMISTYPGYCDLLIPEASLAKPGLFYLPEDTFTRMKNMLVLTKMHIAATDHNVNVIDKAHVPYVILYRDLRDVCVSNYHYINLTPWNSRYKAVSQMTLSQYIDAFYESALTDFCDWIDLWDQKRDKNRSIMVRYEDMLKDPHAVLSNILKVYELPATDERINEMVEANTFAKLSGGRERGQEKKNSFYRKGKAGDWKNHFTQEQADKFMDVAGDWFVRHGYE